MYYYILKIYALILSALYWFGISYDSIGVAIIFLYTCTFIKHEAYLLLGSFSINLPIISFVVGMSTHVVLTGSISTHNGHFTNIPDTLKLGNTKYPVHVHV